MEKLVIRDEDKFREIVSSALEYLKQKADYADILIENIVKVEAKLLSDGQELVIPYSSKAAMQLRIVMGDGRHIELGLGLVGGDKLRKDIDTALSILEDSEPDKEYGLAPIPNPSKEKYGKEIKLDLRDIDTGEAMAAIIDDIKEIAFRIGKKHGAELKPEIWFFSQVEEKIIADIDGIYKTQVLPTTFLQVHVKARKGKKLTQYRVRHADIEGLDFLLEGQLLKDDVRVKIEAAMENAVLLFRARKLSNEELGSLTHYVLAPSTMVFVHEAQGHNFESDIIQEGGSGLIRKDGSPVEERIASDIVHIYDAQPMDGNGNFILDRGFGTQFIDDEGVEVKPVQLVRSGRIVGKLHNRETAHFYKEEPNGRGFSELGDSRVVRMTNTYIAPAGQCYKTKEELISDVKFGVMMEGSLGGAVNKDGMATSLQIGYLIKDGKLTDTVLLPANVTVITKSALLASEGFAWRVVVDDDAGFCGKAGQTKFVTDGGPLIKIRNTDSINLAY